MNGWQKKQINRALDQLENLTDWEHDRMLEWADYPESRSLTEKQNDILNRIAEKLT